MSDGVRASQPRVSVIVASYNTGRFVTQAIESIQATGYPDLEILVVDDGSTDDSMERLAGLARAAGSIRVLTHARHRNHGIPATRNLGIREATGKYIAFLDADDVFFKNRFEVCIPLMEGDTGVEAVSEPFYCTYVSGTRGRDMQGGTGSAGRQCVSAPPLEKERTAAELFDDLLEARNLPHTSSITIRAEALRLTGVFPNLKYCSEPALWLRLYARGRVRDGSQTPVSSYMLHEDSVCARHEHKAAFLFDYILAMMDAYQWMCRHGTARDRVEAVRRHAFGKFYHYCAGVTGRPHSFWRDSVWSAMRFAGEFPEALTTAKFWKVAIRLAGAEVGIVRWE